MLKIRGEQQVEYILLRDRLKEPQQQKFTKYEFDIPFRPRGQDWDARGVTFIDCIFHHHVNISEAQLSEGMRFDQCTFHKGITFDLCKANQSNSNFNENRNISLDFTSCNIGVGLIIQGSELGFGVSLTENCETDRIQLVSSDITQFTLENSIVKKGFEALIINATKGVELINSSIMRLGMMECKFELILRKITCLELVNLDSSTFNTLMIQDGTYSGGFLLKHCHSQYSISVNGATFEKAFFLDQSEATGEKPEKLNGFWISDCDFKAGFDYRGSQTQQTEGLSQLTITCGDQLKGNFDFQNCRIGTTRIQGLNSASIIFAYCRLDQLHLEGLVNKGALTLVSIQPIKYNESFFYISKSVLGKTFLSDCDLRSYESVTITHSNISEVVTTSVEWFAEAQLNRKVMIDIFFNAQMTPLNRATAIRTVDYQIKKDLFRQLKFAMEKQGDQFNRMHFRKEELNAYRNELLYQKLSIKNIGDKLILWLNRSNDYGFNWLKPMLLILSSTFVFNILLSISINPKLTWIPSIENVSYTFHYLLYNFYNYFSLLNPTHRIIDLFGIRDSSKPSFLFYLLDFLERLSISYLLFQMIVAFRKYTK